MLFLVYIYISQASDRIKEKRVDFSLYSIGYFITLIQLRFVSQGAKYRTHSTKLNIRFQSLNIQIEEGKILLNQKVISTIFYLARL